jgi:GNAT superfamily N-acetyltransferase
MNKFYAKNTPQKNIINNMNSYYHQNQIFDIDHFNLLKPAISMWPARHQLLFDGWVLRFFYPYFNRCNCIYTLEKGRLDIHQKIRKCEQLYSQNHYGFVFQILPQFSILDNYLQKKGYRKCQQTRWMSIALNKKKFFLDHAIEYCSIQPSKDWLVCRQTIAGYSEKEAEIYKKFHRTITATKYPFIYQKNQRPVACGLGLQVDNCLGIFDVHTRIDNRRQGYARSLVQMIMRHAQNNGATYAQLHVDINNNAAIQLYQGLGFQLICDYWFRILTDSI